jgi:hypothetical protein
MHNVSDKGMRENRLRKVLLVGDHTDTLNWGGRAQTLALYQLLEIEFSMSGVIEAYIILSTIASNGFVGSIMPTQFINFFLRIRDRLKIIDLYLKFEELLGARDFVGVDIEENVNLLLKYKGKNPYLNGLYEQVKNADLVVVNGEGSGIFTTPHRRDFLFYLTMIELGIQLGKKCFYVNGILSDCPYTGRNEDSLDAARRTLKKCSAVLVRDIESLRFIKDHMPGVKASCIPDALFAWFPIYEEYGHVLPGNGDFILGPPEQHDQLGKLDFSVPYICIGGSSGAALHQEKAASCYTALANAVKELGCKVYLTQNCGGDRFMQQVAKSTGLGLVPVSTPIFMAGAVLTNARVFISGRFHPTIHASLGGTPCVFLDAHSHKMRSLQEMLEYKEKVVFSALPADEDIPGIVAQAKEYIEHNNKLRKERKEVVERLCVEAKSIAKSIKASVG